MQISLALSSRRDNHTRAATAEMAILIVAVFPSRLSRYSNSGATFYKWWSRYGGMELSDARKLKGLEEENRKLKKLLAESMLDVSALKEMLGKNF